MSEQEQETSNAAEADVQQEEAPIPLVEFLESKPPSSIINVEFTIKTEHYHSGDTSYYLVVPQIQIHCPNDDCNGSRFFRGTEDNVGPLIIGKWKFIYIEYKCSNCLTNTKTYSVAFSLNEDRAAGRAYKFGELPMYGPPTPSKLISLIGPDRELFLKGRTSENMGQGIGAFSYYRRVVENQKDRILDEIIKVSKVVGLSAENIEVLENAKKETQFSKAINSVKDALPQSLLIDGHNPLTLLYSALSDGMHAQEDDFCLRIASSIRVVLGELAERLGQALKDEAELKNAVSALLNRPQETVAKSDKDGKSAAAEG